MFNGYTNCKKDLYTENILALLYIVSLPEKSASLVKLKVAFERSHVTLLLPSYTSLT